MNVFAFYMSVSVIWALANPFIINFFNRVFAISRLRLNGVKVIVYSFDLTVVLCDCLTPFFSCVVNCAILLTLNIYLIAHPLISY